jgi:glutamyl-tRNA reductase
MKRGALDHLKVIAFTHKALPFELVGKLHIDPDRRQSELTALKENMGLDELLYLSTCNRVEFFCVTGEKEITPADIIDNIDFNISEAERNQLIQSAEIHSSDDTVKHIFKVSASLDSMVIGEREIITQVRKAFEECNSYGLTGDLIRVLMRKTIETAKTIFTETGVFRKPVSVVSLAFHKLRDLNMPSDSRVLMIGAGKTNRAMAKFLTKHGYENIQIFNRTFERAKELAEDTGANALPLSDLNGYNKGFDVLITCTSSEDPIITESLFQNLMAGETDRKVVIDLAIPGDIDQDALSAYNKIHHINIAELKQIAEKNLAERAKEIEKCEEIIDHSLMNFHDMYRQREIEVAMRDIPKKVKEIKELALNEVYARELQGLNPESREVLDKIVNYLEKKYISVPMKMAKEVMLGQTQK